jgi:hypothetical protein
VEVSPPRVERPIRRSQKPLKRHLNTDLSPRWSRRKTTMTRIMSLVERNSQIKNVNNLPKLKRLSETMITKRKTKTSRISASRQVSGRRKKNSKASSLFS